MTSTGRKVLLVALLGIGAADVAWIDLSAGPRALVPVAIAAPAPTPAPAPPVVAQVEPVHPAPTPPPPVPHATPTPPAPNAAPNPPAHVSPPVVAKVEPPAASPPPVHEPPPAPHPPAPMPTPTTPQVAANVEAPPGATKSPDTLFFTSMSKHLASRERELLDAVAAKAGPHTHIMLVGHTDVRGDQTYNAELSKLRAQVAAGYLIKHGVAAAQITVSSLGSEGAHDATDPELWRDRRVDIQITEGGAE